MRPYRGRAQREPIGAETEKPEALPVEAVELKPSAAAEKAPFIFVAKEEESRESALWTVAILLAALLGVIWIPILWSIVSAP